MLKIIVLFWLIFALDTQSNDPIQPSPQGYGGHAKPINIPPKTLTKEEILDDAYEEALDNITSWRAPKRPARPKPVRDRPLKPRSDSAPAKLIPPAGHSFASTEDMHPAALHSSSNTPATPPVRRAIPFEPHLRRLEEDVIRQMHFKVSVRSAHKDVIKLTVSGFLRDKRMFKQSMDITW